MSGATVDIVIPARDAAPTIERTLEAVLAQVGVDVEVFVVDDGSSDDTHERASTAGDTRVHVVRQDNRGPSAARNAGATIGAAPWIAFLDADQVPHPEWLSTLLARGGQGRIVGCSGRFVGPDGATRLHRIGTHHSGVGPKVIYQPGHFIVRRELFERAGGYDEELRFSENTELGLRIERLVENRTKDISVTDDVLLSTYEPAGGLSRQFSRRRRLDSAERIISKHSGHVPRHQLASYHAIAGVQARNLGHRRSARSHLLAAARLQPRKLRYWAGVVRSIGPDRHTEPVGLVLHVMPADLARGGQAETRTICDALDGERVAHEAVTIFRSPPGNLLPDHCLDVPDGRLRRCGFDPRAAIRLRRFIRRLRPAIVVTHGGESLKYALLTPRSTAVVYHKIGVVTDAASRGIRRRFQRWMLQRPDLVVAVSMDAAQDAIDFGRADPVVVPNCRRTEHFPFSPATEHEGFRALFVGHLTASKQPAVFVDLIALLRSRGMAITGTIAGDGPLRSQIESAAPRGVSVIGRRSDVPALMRDHDALVFTSRREGEGMPGVLIEAGLCARPVVAFDVPGVRDVVIDGETGLVVAVDDVEGLATALDSLARSPTRARAMGLAARRHCEATFDVAVVADAWRAALAPLLPPVAEAPRAERSAAASRAEQVRRDEGAR